MYATNLTDQLFSAALPLKPLVAWCGSACSVTVAVPSAPALAGLNIGSVGVTLSLPDGSSVAEQAVHVANTPLWTATFPAAHFATSGTVAQGLMVTLAGEDENDVVRTWIVAKGDLEVREGDASPSPGGSWVAVKLRTAVPENPVEGDAYVADGRLSIYVDGAWVTIGGVVVDPSIDPASENPVENRAVAAALAAKLDGAAAYPEWVQDDYAPPDIVSHKGRLWRCQNYTISEPGEEPLSDWLEVSIEVLKQDALSAAQMDAVNSGATAEKVAAWDGYAAKKASMSDLPYALVTPGEWTFSGSGVDSGREYEMFFDSDQSEWNLNESTDDEETPWIEIGVAHGTGAELSVEFDGVAITATRASLPGHLLDRAGNRVVVSGDTTLTLPALEYAGRLRDFLVRLEIGGSTVPTITFVAPTGETITYETDGDEFPVPDEAGTWSYSFTENCAAHKFAVSLKKVSVVTQGGV